MKSKIKTVLEEADKDQLLEILMTLCEKYNYLGADIEFILSPKNLKNPQSYYNKLVKKAIDTNSWSKFPNKGVKGLQQMVIKLEFLDKIGNHPEVEKLAKAIYGIIDRCKRNYNSQNTEEMKDILERVDKYLTEI